VERSDTRPLPAGFHSAELVGAALLLVLAVASGLLLRDRAGAGPAATTVPRGTNT